MNDTKMTRWMVAAVAVLGLMSLGTAGAWALDPDTGVFTVRIMPNVDLGVTVDTTGAAWAGKADLDTDIDLNGEKLLGTGVKVTVAGNFQNQEFQLTGAALDTWALDANESVEQDKMRLYGKIGTDQGADLALTGDFTATTDLITGTPTRAGQAQNDEGGDNNHTYEFATGAGARYQDVDGMAVAQNRRLWLRANAPNTTTVDGQQRFTVTVTAVTGTAL